MNALSIFNGVIASLPALHAAAAPAKRPNIVFIYSDDQPQRAMGSVEPYFSTPHLDRLAKMSSRCDTLRKEPR